MVIRIGDKENIIATDGTITVCYLNGTTKVSELENVKFIYLNPEGIDNVTIADKVK